MTVYDEQRKRISKIINLVSSARENNDQKIMSDAMHELDAYWQDDLITEADYLESMKCSHYKLFLREKIYFVKGIASYYTSANDLNYDFVEELIEFLRKWLVSHIQVMEKKVADGLSKRGK